MAERSHEVIQRNTKKCEGCGNQFYRALRGNDAHRFCTKKCSGQARVKSGVYKRLLAERRKKHGVNREFRAVSDGYLWWSSHWKACNECGRQFYAEYISEARCSKECSLERSRRIGRQKANEEYWARQELHFKCPDCGEQVERITNKHKRYCVPCSKKRFREARSASKAKRRAKMMTNGPYETIIPSKVFKRDEWVCQLCGGECDRDEVVPHPKAATVDHILPLANGGTHTMSNVQCAHFECNWRKSDNAIDVDGQVVWEFKHAKQGIRPGHNVTA